MSNGEPRPSTSIRRSPADDAARRTVVALPRDRPMNVPCLVSRRSALAAIALGVAALAAAPARRRGRHLRPRRRELQTGDHRGDAFRRRGHGREDQRRRRHRFRPLDLPPAGQSGELSRNDRQSGRRAQHRRLEDGQRAIRADRTGAASGRRARHGAVPALGHGDRRAGRGPAVHDRRGERAPGRPYDRRRGVHARHRRKGIFRFPRRLRRRERPEGEAAQAAGGHGHGRRQREVARRRRRARRHAALFAVRPAGRLHVVRRRPTPR